MVIGNSAKTVRILSMSNRIQYLALPLQEEAGRG